MLLGCPPVHPSNRHTCPVIGTIHDSFEISYQKLVDPCFFFLSELFPFLELYLFGENHNESLSARYVKKYLS